MTFPVSLKKMIFILENMVFLLMEKIKMIEKFTFTEKITIILNTFIETFIDVFIYCFPMKRNRKLNI